MKTKRVLLLPLFWPGPAGLARCLHRYAAEGWNLDAMDGAGTLRLTLRRTEPAQFRFFLDYCPAPNVEYRNCWEQAGWEYAGLLGKYPLWRTASHGAAVPDGGDSFRSRCRRLRSACRVCAALFGFAAVVLLAGMVLALCRAAPGRAVQALLEAAACGLVAWLQVRSARDCGRMDEQSAPCGGEEEHSV